MVKFVWCISVIMISLLCLNVFSSAQEVSFSYERSYPNGYSTGDDSPDNRITVEPQINNTESGIFFNACCLLLLVIVLAGVVLWGWKR